MIYYLPHLTKPSYELLMNALTTTIALALIIGDAWQDLSLEGRAVARVQQTLASQYDPALPGRPFGNWFNQTVGPQSGVTWHLTECVEQAGAASAGAQDIPVCVEATAILPDDRKVVVQILAGYFKQGPSVKTRFHFAVIEDEDQFRNVQKLGDLPQALRMVFPKNRLRAIALPRTKATVAPRLYIAKAPILVEPPKIVSDETGAEIPSPPKRASAPGSSAPRISLGVSVGDAITRVTPVYPAIARQINASGEVQVEILIDETGRVIQAKAVSGHPMLRAAAEDASRKWVFKPTLLDGKPVKQQGNLTFVFTRAQ